MINFTIHADFADTTSDEFKRFAAALGSMAAGAAPAAEPKAETAPEPKATAPDPYAAAAATVMSLPPTLSGAPREVGSAPALAAPFVPPIPAAPPPATTEKQHTANEAAEVDNELETKENPGNSGRRPRRTKAQIEADFAAAKATLDTARAGGLLPNGHGIAYPPGVGMTAAQSTNGAAPPAPPTPPTQPAAPAPAPHAVAIPPQAATPPAMPEAPKPSADGTMSLADFREALRQLNITNQGVAFSVLKPLGYFTPEHVPAEMREKLISQMVATSFSNDMAAQ